MAQLIPTWIQQPDLMERACIAHVELRLSVIELHLVVELAIEL